MNTEIELIKECYRRLAPRWNTMMDRDHSHWNTDIDSSTNRWAKWVEYWSADHRQIYLLENTTTKAVAGYFAVSDAALPDGGYESTVNEVMFESDDNLDYLARFCRRFPANVKKVKLIVSPNPGLWHLFREPKITTSLHACYQARVVDVELACADRGYSADVNGEVTFAIEDECAPWNAGPWRLQVTGGRGSITRADHQSATPDIPTFTIRDFSAMFTGYKPVTQLASKYPNHGVTLEFLEQAFAGETRLLDFF